MKLTPHDITQNWESIRDRLIYNVEDISEQHINLHVKYDVVNTFGSKLNTMISKSYDTIDDSLYEIIHS